MAVGFAALFLLWVEPVTGMTVKLLSVEKIWDQGAHNAFTDLTRHGDYFYCVFREAEGHVSPEAKIRIIRSKFGKEWESAGLLEMEGQDLRDPKITVTPVGNRLMVLGGAAKRQGKEHATEHRSFAAFSDDGTSWGPLEWVADQDQWLWRVTWHKGIAYGVAYSAGLENRKDSSYWTTLLYSEDGKKFRTRLPTLRKEGGPNEATLRFAQDSETCYCLQRRDGKETNTALLGICGHPYTSWTWNDLGRYFGGPNFIQLPDGRWLAAGRLHTDDGSKTAICELVTNTPARLEPLLYLPSGGDTSYPGLLWYNDELWVSYYSSHEGKTSIYLARLKVE